MYAKCQPCITRRKRARYLVLISIRLAWGFWTSRVFFQAFNGYKNIHPCQSFIYSYVCNWMQKNTLTYN